MSLQLPADRHHCVALYKMITRQLLVETRWELIKQIPSVPLLFQISALWKYWLCIEYHIQIDGLVQERCNSIAKVLELHLSCIYLSIFDQLNSSDSGQI